MSGSHLKEDDDNAGGGATSPAPGSSSQYLKGGGPGKTAIVSASSPARKKGDSSMNTTANGGASSPLLSKLQSAHHQLQPLSGSLSQMSPQGGVAGGVAGGVPGVVGASGVSGVANSAGLAGGIPKMRMLEDFLEEVDASKSHPHKGPSALRFDTTGSGGGHEGGKVHRTAAEREMRRIEKENASRRIRNNDAKQTFEHARKHKIENWVHIADRNNKKLEKENDALKRVAQLTQENCINNDARYDETINSLRSELEYTTLFRQDSADTLSYVREAVGTIQEKILHMRNTGERQAQADHTRLKRELEELLVQRTQELEDVRESGSNTTGEWVAKNKSLQMEVEKLLYQTDAEYGVNQELLLKHKQLEVEHNAQADDGTILERQFHTASQHHQRLRDRIHDLELELAGAGTAMMDQEEAGAGGALSEMIEVQQGLQKSSFDHEQSAAYASALRKAQAILEQEAENLAQVRAAHVKALKQRTELEVFLRQAIMHHVRRNKERLMHISDESGAAMGTQRREGALAIATNFTIQDRRSLMESLLTKERVLQLLYNEDAATQRPPALSDMDHDGAFSERSSQNPLSTGGGNSSSTPRGSALRGSSSVNLSRERKTASFKQSPGTRNGRQHPTTRDRSINSNDIEELWTQWKSWTLSAEAAMAKEDANAAAAAAAANA